MTANTNTLVARMLRVSTPLQAQKGYSLEVQDEVLSGLIVREGYTTRPELVLEDDGFEGDDWSRPAIRQGLDWVRAGKVKGLAFLDTDRFARDLHGALGFLKEIRKAGGVVLFADIGAYRDDAEFQILLNLKLSIGQYAKTKTKALSRTATLRKVRNGEVHIGRPLYGYRYVAKTKDSRATLMVIPEQAKVIVTIYMQYLEGASLRAIVRRLVADGVPPPRTRWNATTIAGILTDRTYLGTWHYNKTQSIEPQQPRSTGPPAPAPHVAKGATRIRVGRRAC
jgi:DNA invertase Pin-like site-specific DNA recombinase